MNSSNNGNNNNPQPPQQGRNLSRNRRYTQSPSGHERGAFAVRGVDGGSQSVSDDIHDDVTLLEPQDSSAQPPIPSRGGGRGQATATDASSSTQQQNLGEEEEPAAVITHASVVDEQAEAERERLLQEQTARLAQVEREREAERQRMERRQLELEEARLRERRRVLELEEELGRVRSSSAAGGATMPTAFVERLVPRQEEEEEKQEVADPVPTPHQDQQDGTHETPQDLEAPPERLGPISVRPVDDDTTLEGLDSTGASAGLQMNGDNYGNEDESSDSSSNNSKRQGASSSSSSNTRPRRRILAAVGILVLVLVVVIVAMMVTGGMSSGGSGSSSSTNTDPARLPAPPDSTTDPTIPPTAPPTAPPTRRPTPPETTTSTTTEPTTLPPPLPETAVSWKQLGADLNGVAIDDRFGHSIALSADGTILAVGALYNDANGEDSGQVRVFAYETTTTTTTTASGGQWKQLGANLNGAAALDWFGTSVALSADGTILAVGAAGHVRVFSYSKENNQWKLLGADLNGESDLDWFGYSVALSGDGTILAVGAYGNDDNGNNSGQVRVFQYGKAEGRWIQLGADLNGEAAGDEFGISVALSEDGTILAAGGWYNDGNGDDSGHARVFRYNAASHHWSQLGADLDGKAAGDRFGRSVALSSSGFILAVGGPYNDANGDGSGHVRVFEYSTASNKWKQLGGDLGGQAAGDWFGGSVALSSDGTVMVVGARYNDDNGWNSGHARIFHYNKANQQWNKLGEDLNGKAASDRFGWSVALSADGTIVAGGAYGNDDNGADSGQVQVFQRSNKSDDP